MTHPKILLQRFLTWIAKVLATSRIPLLKTCLIKGFIRYYHLDLSEVADPDLKNYPNYRSFFIRKLRPELRPIAVGAEKIVSPVDGIISQLGKINDQEIFQAKGKYYNLPKLLGNDDAMTKLFLNGNFLTAYLSPTDYHRVHMPYMGKLIKTIYIPGELFSVGPKTVANVPDLFARNERLICLFETIIGPMAVILVGATLVSGIVTNWAGPINTPKGKQILALDYSHALPAIPLEKGAELGYFEMGSTVIVLFPQNKILWNDNLNSGKKIKYGEWIATINGASK